MRRLLAIGSLLVAGACATSSRPTLQPGKMAELWQEPQDLERRNLRWGPGGRERAPRPDGQYKLLSEKKKGFSPGYDVEDEEGRRWSVKLGPESRTEVVVSRLVWAVGYHQALVYYVPRWTLADNGKTSPQGPARFRLESSAEEKTGEWSWRDNPFLDTRPMAGMFVLMVMVNNWDLKSQQNAIYRSEPSEPGPRERYVVNDLGASLGKTSWLVPGNRDNLEDFEREPFVERVEGNRVRFHFQGAWREPQLANLVTPSDVAWMCKLLARLTRQQWMDAFRAADYDEPEAGRYIRRLQEKVEEGLSLD
jgi:hypothetical protein